MTQQQRRFSAHDGFSLPAIGFGAWSLKGQGGHDAVVSAIGNGYTLIDSAVNYENEGLVGHAVRTSGADRASITVTSKLPGRFHSYDLALESIQESVFRTGLDAIDLHLIHWPNPLEGRYVDAWKAMIAAKDMGLVRAIGVSNFLPEHLDRLADETGVLPVVNQIELHPYFTQDEQLEYHREHGIITEAWSPVGRDSALLDEPVIGEVAAAHSITPAQAVLAWHVNRGVLPLPKSRSAKHQRENLEAASIELTADEIAAISSLHRADGRLAGQDPRTHQEF